MLSTRKLSVGIAGQTIAKSDDIDLNSGEILILIGRNGSGKSTFLRTICGLLKPMSGEFLVEGQAANLHRLEQKIAWLSQDEHLEFAWSVREYVGLGRLAHNTSLSRSKGDQDQVDQAMLLADCQGLADRFANELSGGERQRVRLARALAQDTPIIAMDEPTTHLDLDHQIQFLRLLAGLAAKGKTILASLHDVSQANLIGSQYLLFNNGHAHWIAHHEALTKELLEGTLGVRFEQSGGQFLPIYTIGSTEKTHSSSV